MMKLHHVKQGENDIPDFFSIAFISFLFYCILFTIFTIFNSIFNIHIINKLAIVLFLLLIIIGTSIVVFKYKKWHKDDASIELSKIPKRTKYLSYTFIVFCFVLFIFSIFW